QNGSLRPRWKFAIRERQHENVIEFHALGVVHGEQLHGIIGALLLLDNVAAVLEKEIKILDESEERFLFALAFPLGDGLGEALEMQTVGIGRKRRKAESGDKGIENHARACASGELAQFAQKRDELSGFHLRSERELSLRRFEHVHE